VDSGSNPSSGGVAVSNSTGASYKNMVPRGAYECDVSVSSRKAAYVRAKQTNIRTWCFIAEKRI
jgi:hypothetical protein